MALCFVEIKTPNLDRSKVNMTKRNSFKTEFVNVSTIKQIDRFDHQTNQRRSVTNKTVKSDNVIDDEDDFLYCDDVITEDSDWINIKSPGAIEEKQMSDASMDNCHLDREISDTDIEQRTIQVDLLPSKVLLGPLYCLVVGCQDGCIRVITFRYSIDGFKDICHDQVIVDGPILCLNVQRQQQQLFRCTSQQMEAEDVERIVITAGSLCGYVTAVSFHIHHLQFLSESCQDDPHHISESQPTPRPSNIYKGKALSSPRIVVDSLVTPASTNGGGTNRQPPTEDPVLTIASSGEDILVGTYSGRCLLLRRKNNSSVQLDNNRFRKVLAPVSDDEDDTLISDYSTASTVERINGPFRVEGLFENEIDDSGNLGKFHIVCESQLPFCIHCVKFLDDHHNRRQILVITRRSVHIFEQMNLN
jgi:hypothetical protein